MLDGTFLLALVCIQGLVHRFNCKGISIRGVFRKTMTWEQAFGACYTYEKVAAVVWTLPSSTASTVCRGWRPPSHRTGTEREGSNATNPSRHYWKQAEHTTVSLFKQKHCLRRSKISHFGRPGSKLSAFCLPFSSTHTKPLSFTAFLNTLKVY